MDPCLDSSSGRRSLRVARPWSTETWRQRCVLFRGQSADLADGLLVGDASRAGVDTARVAGLVNRVLDGTYPDVHGILAYQGGRHQWLNVSAPEGTRRVDMVVATGNGGQKIYLVPSLDLVVVLTGGNYNATLAGDRDHGEGVAPGVPEPNRGLEMRRAADPSHVTSRFDAVTRLVPANGLPYQKRQPSLRRAIAVAPSLRSVSP
jgi:hypothetical protein